MTSKIDTKKKALKLLYDPTCLLKLLYSKYGDIEEDYDILIINQLVYDSSSHVNIYFKEYQFLENYDEYLKRWYKIKESSIRVPKLSEYYKNYHKFFCKPNFNDFMISSLMHNYGDDKAELFYKDNFDFSKSENGEDISEKNNTSSLSSIDNITSNKTIFTKKNKFIIEKNEKSINYSMTLTLNNTTINSIKNDKKNLISPRSNQNSFEKIVHDLVYYQKKKANKKNKKKKQEGKNMNEKINNDNKKEKVVNDSLPKKIINIINDLDKNKVKAYNNIIFNKEKKSPLQLTILSKPHILNHHNNKCNKISGFKNNYNILNTILKTFNSPKNGIKGQQNTYKTKLEEYKNNCNIPTKRDNNNTRHRNKTYNFSQNYSLSNQSGENMTQNLMNLINSKGLRKNTSQNKTNFNYILTFKNLAKKPSSKIKKKNKTFDNNIYTQINQISSMPFLKYKKTSPSNKQLNSQYNSNKNLIKKNNFIGSKFNLVKNLKTTSNMEKAKGKKNSSYNYYQNILTQIFPENKIKKNKNITSFGLNNNTSNSSKKKSISPINSNKNDKIHNNINNIKNRNKLTKNQINNFNINFNNVFFTSSKPTSYNIDNNKNFNNSHTFSSINVNKNMSNSSLSNNIIGNNLVNSNIQEHEKLNKNLYIMNLKNIYNFSRNKNNILMNNNPLTQTETNHTKIQNNYNIIHIHKNNYTNNLNKIKDAKIIFEKNAVQRNSINLLGNEEISLNNKNQIPNNKKENQNDIINFIKKTQANFIMRNHNRNNLEGIKNYKILNTGDEKNKNNLKNNKSFNCSKNKYSSNSVSRRKNKSKIDINNGNKAKNIYDKKVSSLTSQKNIKSKHKRKIK